MYEPDRLSLRDLRELEALAPPKVTIVETCRCGCGEIPPCGREYVVGHEGKCRRSKT